MTAIHEGTVPAVSLAGHEATIDVTTNTERGLIMLETDASGWIYNPALIDIPSALVLIGLLQAAIDTLKGADS